MATQEVTSFYPMIKQETCRTPSPDEHLSTLPVSISSSSSGTSHDQSILTSVPNPVAKSASGHGVPCPAPVPVPNWGKSSSPVFEAPPQVHFSSGIPSVPSVVSASSGSGSNTWAVAGSESCPNFSVGTTTPNSGPSPGRKASNRKRYGKAAENAADSVNARRQKRLERNRESARLSRRRRKQYLEVLEDRVTQLSMENDKGRRAHVAKGVETIQRKRRDTLEAADKSEGERVYLLDTALSRANAELRLATTFKTQQLRSFSLPAHSKFYLWLTLQSDQYFRGGRAASERLSAARIGERMLNSGTDKVPPAQSMWPLFCNEVGLSYDQEERVRSMQRTLLQNHESWLQRHTAHAADSVMTSAHDSTQAITVKLGQKERSMLSVLSNSQRLKFLSWAERNRDRISRIMTNNQTTKSDEEGEYKISKDHHTAANLYVLNHKLQQILNKIPRARSQVTGAEMKKLSRRPSFESLGRAGEKSLKDDGGPMMNESSFNSSGSLKASSSTVSMDEQDRMQVQQISAEEAEASAAPTVDQHLGFVKAIIPPIPAPEYVIHDASALVLRIPSPTQVTSTPIHVPVPVPAPAPSQPVQVYSYMQAPTPLHAPTPIQPSHVPIHVPMHQGPVPSPLYGQAPVPSPLYMPGPMPGPMQTPETDVTMRTSHPGEHVRKSSFLPPHLNVVPEEMFPSDAADDFLIGLVGGGAEDWAIGEGIDMDTSA